MLEEAQKGNNTGQLLETHARGTPPLIHHRRPLTAGGGVGTKPQTSKKVNCLVLCLNAKRKLV